MGRTSENITQAEIDVFNKFCIDNRIVIDGEVGVQNGNLFGEYIAIQWQQDITPQTLKVALEKLGDQIKFYTPAQFEYRQVASENEDRANALNDWFQSSANRSLVKEGEELYHNQTVLLAELRGRAITPETIQAAIGRAGLRGGLHYVTTKRTADPRQHADDGKGFMSKSDTNVSPAEHARRAAQAADRNAGRSSTPCV